MDIKLPAPGICALAALGCLLCLQDARATAPRSGGESAARVSAGAVPASRLQGERSPRPGPITASRADKPVVAVTAVGAGQSGYVHFFIVGHPDETAEIQVGIELSDGRIAWSFPGMGAVISPFIEAGPVQAGDQEYPVWHLYGVRPFADPASMAALRAALAGRVESMVKARLPYCLDDGPRSRCVSCLGFVLRALFPGRRSDDYPNLPRDFWRAGYMSRYSTNDLLLYLTGMLELPTRVARLRRLAGLSLPQELHDDLERLVYQMGAVEANAETPRRPVPKQPGDSLPKGGVLPPRARKL